MIYFIQPIDGGLIKIGYAENVGERFKSIQLMSPLILRVLNTMDGDKELEGHLHRYFGKLQHHGEWFRPSEDLLEFVRSPHPIECHTRNGGFCNGVCRDGKPCSYRRRIGTDFCRYHQDQANGVPEGHLLIIPRLTEKCKGINERGEPCRKPPFKGQLYCFYHSHLLVLDKE